MGSLRAILTVFTTTLLAATLVAATPSAAGPDARARASDAAAQNRSADTSDAVAPAQCDIDPPTPKRQFRAMWIASVHNIDWPSRTGLSVSQQQAEFRSWLDVAEENNFNAVIVQIRPTADAFWPSPHEPWSHWLTGTQGRDPGYDPLEFMVAEAHKRNIEFHAWFNPYRVATHTNVNNLAAGHPVRQNPDWAFAYNGQLYYNPGIPAVREFVQDAMMHAVQNYDVDGVHFDDYFYPYPASGQQIPDQDTYNQYGGGFSNIGDWRRNNVDLLVQEMNARIKQAKPHVKFGISPFGIWRNSSTDPAGSNTNGLQSYDAIYADSRRWVTEGWLDYINPQIYWEIGHSAADYAVLVPWWSDVVSGTDVQLYVGQAAYKVGDGGAWNDATELSDHLHLNRNHPEVRGDVYFSAKDVDTDRLGSISRLTADHYRRPALIPDMPQLGGSAPSAPSITDADRTGSGVSLTISGNASSYAVYRFNGDTTADPCDFDDASHLIGTVRASGSGATFTDSTADSQGYTYYVTALDRTQLESEPSARAVVQPGSGGSWSMTIDDADSGFTAGDSWGTSSWSSERHGDGYRYADPVAASDVAWFLADVPANGSYRVEVWYPSNSGYNSATPYIIATSGGNEVVRVDQRSGGGQWVDLGTFTLPAGERNVVGVSRWTSTSGYVVADAVRITRV
ncbi:family 10 glycosylhydrolase [Phytoactinopolyspora halotolerans]|uniref:Family 10 glycosylhydrolase n=1 Tax=Phytoactinopolyspora halotolerans TaxID=1981512 RepID=A0A6L9SIE9_9ACTN|nr:family 10 glycosylhydrolase [Phytoactinopolyspora halotolerans]NEE04444.1 family 10 glycosylhydrolase [Phytoactinopolyspora halotolerans]